MALPIERTRNRVKPMANRNVFQRQEDGLVPAPLTITGKILSDSGEWIEAAVGSGITPTGTGFVHITSGVQDAAAKLVRNPDVHASANIAESKLNLNFPTHDNSNDPSSDEKDALVGTDGTPNASNPYVTDSDPRLGAGGSVPTGTGFVHISSGVQDGAAQLVVNADVDAAAAIVESKLSLNFPTHSNANDPSSDEKDALIGTDGTPSAANPYVTDSDPRLVGGSATLADGDYGDVTVSGTGTVITVDNDVITYAKIQNVSATDRLLGRDTAAAGDVEELTVGGGLQFTGSGGIERSALTGDVTAPAGSNTTTVPTHQLTLDKLQAINEGELLGRSTAGSGDVEQIIVNSPLLIATGSGSLDFDQTFLLGNNARVEVKKNGTGVATRRGVNLIEGTHISLTVVDDAGNEEVDVTFDVTDVADALHASNHEAGGPDEISIDGLTGRSATTQFIELELSGVSQGEHPGINFIGGSDINITVTPGGTPSDLFDVQIDYTGAGGSAPTFPQIMSRISLRF